MQFHAQTLSTPSTLHEAGSPGLLVQIVCQRSQLEKALNVVSGDWVLIRHQSRAAVGQAIFDPGLCGSCDDDCVLISPILMHYLERSHLLETRSQRRLPVTIDRLTDTSSFTWPSSPSCPVPIAERATLHQVRSNCPQVDSSTIQFVFNVPHVLTNGMIIPIPLDPSATVLVDSKKCSTNVSAPAVSDLNQIHYPGSVDCVFYQVCCEDTPFFTIDKEHTQFSIGPTCINAFVPYESTRYIATLDQVDQSSFMSHAQYRVVQSMISPFLHPLSHRLRIFPDILISGPRRSGKRIVVAHAARSLGMHLLEVNLFDLLQPTDRETMLKIRQVLLSVASSYPLIVHIRRLSALQEHSAFQGRPDASLLIAGFRQELHNLHSACESPYVIIIGSCDDGDGGFVASLQSCFPHAISMEPLDAASREVCISANSTMSCADILKTSVSMTAGATFGDVLDFCGQVDAAVYDRHPKSIPQTKTLCLDDLGDLYGAEEDAALQVVDSETPANLTVEDVISASKILNARNSLIKGASGTTSSIPNVKWDDIGGLSDVKKTIYDIIELPLQHSSLISGGFRQRAGLLLFGPPGTGKTLVAKAIATECGLNFISVKGPELLNMYVGESEANIRSVFDRARACRPCVLFFDELDSLAPSRGQGSDSGGVMDRVVSQLLAELDGMNRVADVFVIGATNRPDLIDSALLRPGRLDVCIYLGVSSDQSDQLKILTALTRKFDLAEDVDFLDITSSCPSTFTGADFYALAADAMLLAIKARIESINKSFEEFNRTNCGDSVTLSKFFKQYNDSPGIMVTKQHFHTALRHLSPSISPSELQRYERMKTQFEESRMHCNLSSD
uniref:Peroxisomal ATPase PEX6 n=1 Tax=Spongospora subterranea TaxID=70186 RepID=A0A0H5QU20_9EUKA|eukprot:CRZ05222.1 hypothetical protein [Spongospora subterranea]